MSGGSGGGSGVSHGVSKVVKGVTSTVKNVVGGVGNVVGGVVNAVTGQQPQQQVVYYDSDGSADNSTVTTYQTAQSTGSDQYEEGNSPNSYANGSILTGNSTGNLMLGKQSLLGKRL